MSTNSAIILSEVIKQRQEESGSKSATADFFEVFCAEEILKDYDLTSDDIELGIVDGEHDGGIDSIYSFINGSPVYEDFDATPYKKNITFEIHIIQSKSTSGFSESSIDKLIASCGKLLKLDADYANLPQYSEAVRNAFEVTRSALRSVLGKLPKIKIHYHYAAARANNNISDNLKAKADDLVAVTHNLFPSAEVTFNFLGPDDLTEIAGRQKRTVFNLKCVKAFRDGDGYVALVGLRDYFDFLSNGGIWNDEIFEENVRDDQGSTGVNDQILATLISEDKLDFWIMNNGITILASNIQFNEPQFDIESPQIVNGLQTSRQIFNYFSETGTKEDSRKVMIKIIGSEDDDARDKIIKSTNSQNQVQKASLRATDKIQRQIEILLKREGIYYDRRKNYYKNHGAKPAQIITIPKLSQALMSVVLNRPDDARARPSNIISKDEDYKRLFSDAYPIELYLKVAKLQKTLEAALKATPGLTARDRNNIQFYVLNYLVFVTLETTSPKANAISKINLDAIDHCSVANAISVVWGKFQELGGGDQTAKGARFKEEIVEMANKALVAVEAGS